MNMKRKTKQGSKAAPQVKADKLELLKRAVAGWKADGRPGGIVVVKKPASSGKGEK